MTHKETSAYRGTFVTVDIGNGPQSLYVEDWWDRVGGASWSSLEFAGNWACKNYASRVQAHGLPSDDNVLYGKIGAFGHLVHASEIVR